MRGKKKRKEKKGVTHKICHHTQSKLKINVREKVWNAFWMSPTSVVVDVVIIVSSRRLRLSFGCCWYCYLSLKINDRSLLKNMQYLQCVRALVCANGSTHTHTNENRRARLFIDENTIKI